MLSWRKTRLMIENAIYKKGSINVALDHAERSKTYKSFVKKLEQALFLQISRIANHPGRIDSLILLAKAESVPDSLVKQIEVFLSDLSIGRLVNMSIFLQWAGNEGGQAALDKLGIEGVFGLVNRQVIEYFDDRSNMIIASVDNTTRDWIARRIQDGKTEGLTPQQIANTLIDEGKRISKSRAEKIAITETANAMVKVELQAAKSYGIKEKIWRTSLDDRVDEICVGLEGTITTIDGLFDGEYEGPPAHPLCRCFIEEVVPEGWVIPSDPWLGE